MSKNFQKWHGKKSEIDAIGQRPFFHEREIWFCYLGANVGFEQDGYGDDFLRPVVILRKFNNEIFLAVPLTKLKSNKRKISMRYYYEFSFISNIKSAAVLSQVRLIDAKRLARHVGVLPDHQFQELKEKLKALLP
jgi:mRNA interferase MazF